MIDKISDEEKKNEQLFKNMAMTFSTEGITEDIQSLIQKKMNFHVKTLKEIGNMVNSIASSKDVTVRALLLKDSRITKFLNVALSDYKILSASTNILLRDLMDKKRIIIEALGSDEGKIK